jgi:hypothetical protein
VVRQATAIVRLAERIFSVFGGGSRSRVRFDDTDCDQSVIRQSAQNMVTLSMKLVNERQLVAAAEQLYQERYRGVQMVSYIERNLAGHLLERIKSSKENSALLCMGKGIEVAIPSIDSGHNA